MGRKILIAAWASWFVVVVILVSSRAQARDGPLIPTHTITPSVTPTSSPTPTKTPRPTATPTPTRIPTPTLEPGVAVTANYKVRRCALYEKIIVRWIEMEKSPKDEFHNLTLDNVPLVMAIMAAESGCDPYVKSSAGAIGLMQVIPRPWYADVRQNGMNVYVGMYILDRSIDLADGDVRLALAFYNCGVPKVEADACGTKGGVHYADKVLDFWLPFFIQEE